MPERLRTTLRFNKTATMNNVGQIFGNQRLAWTDAYDVDPVLGSTAMPGFTELGTIYTHYRCNSCYCSGSFSNNESGPNTVYLALCNVDPGANTVNYQDFLSSRRSVKKLVGRNDANPCTTLSIMAKQSDFGGVLLHSRVLDGTVGITTAGSPANNSYIVIGFLGAVSSASGIAISIDVDIELDFFELYSPHA